jgi:hypothetical protein
MPGKPDAEKREAVRNVLLARPSDHVSDRQVAKETGVSRDVVKDVRLELITAGQLPDKVYKRGAASRGGFRYGNRSREEKVREVVWLIERIEEVDPECAKKVRAYYEQFSQ